MIFKLFVDRSTLGASADATMAGASQYALNLTLSGNGAVSATVVLQGYNGAAWVEVATFSLAGSQRAYKGAQANTTAYSRYRFQITQITGSLDANITLTASANPKVKRKVRRDIAGLGDSFVANCHTIQANAAYATEVYGMLGGIAMAMGCFAPYTENYGLVGDTTNGFFARATAAFTGKADVVITPSVTNDRTDATLTIADTKANILKLLSIARANGKYYCVGTGTPRFGTKALTSAQEADALEFKRWVLDELSLLTVVCNEWDGFTQAMTVDDLHPNPLGQAFLTARWVEVLSADFDFGQPPYLTFVGQLYGPKRPYGSLTANPLLAGSTAFSGGTSNAEAGSVIADGMTAGGVNLTGMTTKWSLEDAGNGKAQVVELKGALTTAGGYLTFAPTVKPVLTNFAAGDVIEAIAVVDNSADAPCLLSWELELIVTKPIATVSTNLYFRAMDKYQEPFSMAAKSSGVLETQRYTVDKTETSITWRLTCYPANGVAQSNSRVKASQVGLIKL